MLNKFHVFIGIFFAASINAKSLPTKEQLESNEEYRLIKEHKMIPCVFIDKNTDYALQNKCFHISKRLFEITKNKTFLAGVAKGYYKGYGVDQNVKKGLKLYEEIAHSDCAVAVDVQDILGIYYGAKDSPVLDKVKEEYWVKKAAKNGSELSQYSYARMLKNQGKLNDAIYWYKKAAQNGSLSAKYKLAALFREGYPMQINRRQAYQLLHEAAEQGYAPAFHELSFFYDEDGDKEKTEFWHAKFINSDVFKKMQSGMNPDEALIEVFKEQKKKEYIAEVQKEMEEIEKQSSKQK